MDKDLEKIVERFVICGQQNQPIKKYASTPGIDLPGTYIIRHTESGKIYPGSSGQVGYRLFKHKSTLRLGTHGNKDLQQAYNQHPHLDFLVFVVATREEAFDFEQELLDKYWNSGLLFNIGRDARMATKGLVVSEETREKLRIKNTGKKHTPESIIKMQLVQKGKVKTPEHIRKIHESRKGWKPSEEQNAAQSLRLKGVARSSEARENIRLGHLHRSKAVIIDNVEYPSIMQAARSLGLDKNTLKVRIKSSNPKFANWKMKD